MSLHAHEQRPSDERSRVAGVIFDIDGTLTKTNELIFASFNHVAEKYVGRRYTPPEIIAMFGPPEEGALAQIVGDEAVGAAMDDLCRYYREHHGRLAGLHPGMQEMLADLRTHGVILAVFTGKGRRTTLITLEALGIDGYFDMIVSGSDLDRHKPDPEGIRRVLEQFGLPAAEVLMVGDSAGDVTAARGAGVTSVAVLWDSYDPERVLRASPDRVFYRVEDLASWFRTSVRFTLHPARRQGDSQQRERP
ncbi:MAG: HAD-IA family hydrolase [Bacteroidota bacterium]